MDSLDFEDVGKRFAERCKAGQILGSTHPLDAYTFGYEDAISATRPRHKFYFAIGIGVGMTLASLVHLAVNYYYTPKIDAANLRLERIPPGELECSNP